MNTDLLSKAAALCSKTEKCAYDIRQKLLAWGASADDSDSIIERLVAERFIDDARYARAFVNDKFRFEHWGRVKISYTLRAKQIDDAVISAAMDDVIAPDDYRQVCADLLSQRMRGMSQPLSAADRARLFRYAAQRGFEASVIAAVFPSLDPDD